MVAMAGGEPRGVERGVSRGVIAFGLVVALSISMATFWGLSLGE